MTNTLVQKITTDAETKSTAIKAAAMVAVEVIEAATKRVVDELNASAAVQLAKNQTQLELVMLAKANQTAKIAAAAAKRTAIDELFNQVQADALAESGAAYVTRYTKRAQAALPVGIAVLIVQAPVAKADETQEILTALGITVAATLTPEVRAGLIITTADGVYDISFDRIMSEARPNLEMELVRTNS